jgi:hypothetical protein
MQRLRREHAIHFKDRRLKHVIRVGLLLDQPTDVFFFFLLLLLLLGKRLGLGLVASIDVVRVLPLTLELSEALCVALRIELTLIIELTLVVEHHALRVDVETIFSSLLEAM